MVNSQPDTILFVQDVQKSYGSKIVLEDIDLKVRKGEFCTVVGPSGCGKSTLLRLVLGQEKPSSGSILVNGQEVDTPSPQRGIVYQRYALFPHLTILENIYMGKILPHPFWKRITLRKEAKKEAMHYLESVHLADHASKYPHQLSGGMQQRVAIAQALIMKPEILLMDEPFGALDPGTREAMQVLILELWEKHNMTVFFVTHDLEEAVFLGTRILVLSQFFWAGKESPEDQDHGARIVVDYPLSKETASSTSIKTHAEFGQLIQKIRGEGFNPEQRQHVTEFDLKHPDSFQTLSPEDH